MNPETKGSRRGPSPTLTLVTLCALLTSGCLGIQYEIPRSELERLVRTPPEQRGQAVHAVQQFTTASNPDPADPWPQPEAEPPPGYGPSIHGHFWIPNIYTDWGPPTHRPNAAWSGPPTVHEATGVGQPATKPSSSNSGSGGIGNVDKLLVAAVVVGVAVGVGLAASEGARYEGTVAVHPRHPVHLWYGNGKQGVAALDELSDEDLRNVTRASLMGDEGAGLWERAPAPLNRQGFTYQFGAGEDHFALRGPLSERSLGFNFAVGYFPVRSFGLLANSRLQWSSAEERSFYNVRLGVEAQWYPVNLWRLHLGPFGGAGTSWSASAGRELPDTEDQRTYLSFGGLAEFEVTTRLALTFRWTQDWLPRTPQDTSHLIGSWSVGLAVY